MPRPLGCSVLASYASWPAPGGLWVWDVAQTLGHVRFLLLYEAFSMHQSAVDLSLLGRFCLFITLHLLISTDVQRPRQCTPPTRAPPAYTLVFVEIGLLTRPRIPSSSQLSAPLRSSKDVTAPSAHRSLGQTDSLEYWYTLRLIVPRWFQQPAYRRSPAVPPSPILHAAAMIFCIQPLRWLSRGKCTTGRGRTSTGST